MATNTAEVDFPERITFKLSGTSPFIIEKVVLRYGIDERRAINEVRTAQPAFFPSPQLRVEWNWQMNKTGQIPPGATVWWEWALTGADGKTTTTPRRTQVYADVDFNNWKSLKLTRFDIYWDPWSKADVAAIARKVESRLNTLQLDISIPQERKPKIMVYSSIYDLQAALLGEQAWAGAVAFPEYNIILTPIGGEHEEWEERTLIHEITHLFVAETVLGPFGGMPRWLDEGLATYSEGEMTAEDRQLLSTALLSGTLLSLNSLAGQFPDDSDQAQLAYAESGGVVSYLVAKYGWDKMRGLLALFKDGASYDAALMKIYQVDVRTLDLTWRESIGIQ